MRLRPLCLLAVVLRLGAFATAASVTDPDPLEGRRPVDAVTAAGLSASQRAARDAHRSSALVQLPDPALLDGSNQAAEKKPEYGMLGEFEIPGSDDQGAKDSAQSDQKQSGGGGQQQNNKSQKNGGSQSQQGSLPQGASGGASDQADQSQSGGAGDESADASQSGGGSSGSKSASKSGSKSGSKSSKGGGSSKSIAQNDPSASAQGVESSGLSSPDGGEAAAQGDAPPPKPGEQKIGDASMQIKTQTSATAPNVVGLQQPVGKDVPQQYDARTPGGGKQNGAGNGNKGVEKGQTMPTGL